MDQAQFEKTVRKFENIEDARDQLWGRAQKLIEKGFEVEAYVLILATWNFARFRYFMKTFKLREFRNVISKVNPLFRKLARKTFFDIDRNDEALVDDIKTIYQNLKDVAEQTGATKIMALKNPALFVMWDTEIRRIYGIDNKANPEDYIDFLIKMREHFRNIKWNDKNRPFAKAIDEYNYVRADRNRNRKRKK